jgi:hypothetical protein
VSLATAGRDHLEAGDGTIALAKLMIEKSGDAFSSSHRHGQKIAALAIGLQCRRGPLQLHPPPADLLSASG